MDVAQDYERVLEGGWTRRSVAGEPRLSEIVALYRELGHEVLLVPVVRDAALSGGEQGCAVCFEGEGAADGHMVVYTKPGADAGEAR